MNFVIAIDGHAASGKGTIARAISKCFGFSYLDTGLIYRALSKIALSKSKAPLSTKELVKIARSFSSEFLKLKNLRSDEVGTYASKIAAIPEVRRELSRFQRNFALESEGAVLDGRDIGTVIFPDAQLKFFITADLEIRAERRYQELLKWDRLVNFQKVRSDLSKRDHLDSSRRHAPLKISKDAYLIDTSELSIETAVAQVTTLVKKALEKN